MSHHPTYLRTILILSFHLSLGPPSGLFPSGLHTKTLYAPLLFPIRVTCPTHRIFLILSPKYSLVSRKFLKIIGGPSIIKLREMGEEVSYVTVANQTAVSIGAFMYALMLPGGLRYAAVSVLVPHSYTIRKLSHFIFNNL